MVMLRLLFTSRKSRQSSSFSLTRKGTVRGWDPLPGLWGSPPGVRVPPSPHQLLGTVPQALRQALAGGAEEELAVHGAELPLHRAQSLQQPGPGDKGDTLLVCVLHSREIPGGCRHPPPPRTHSRLLPGSLREKILFLNSTQAFCNYRDRAQRLASGTDGRGPCIPAPTWTSCPLSFFTNLSMRCRSSARKGKLRGAPTSCPSSSFFSSSKNPSSSWCKVTATWIVGLCGRRGRGVRQDPAQLRCLHLTAHLGQQHEGDARPEREAVHGVGQQGAVAVPHVDIQEDPPGV